MPVKYRKFVSLFFILPLMLMLLSSPANAFNWGSKNKHECLQQTANSNYHTKWQRFFHIKRYWFSAHYCTQKAPKLVIEGDSDFASSEHIELSAKLRSQRPNPHYSWSQVSGTTATFISSTSEEHVSIELPTVSNAETLTFKVAVKYHHKRPIYAFKTITVNEPVIPTSHISGRILNINGTPISNVDITALDNSGLIEAVITQSDSNGEFSLTLAAQTNYVLQLSGPSVSMKVIPVTSPSENNTFSFNDLVMINRGAVESISVDGEQTIASHDGASVRFDKANFVDANGQPLVGDMQLTVTPLDVSNTRSISAFPGLSLGIPEGGVTPEMIVSLGAVEFHFTHNGEPVNLASGATADILIPIYVNQYPDGQAIEVGQTTPLRSLNEATGVWSQEGVGTIVYSNDSPTGLAYQATVSHFSWWGSDVAIATAPGDTTPNTGVAYTVITVNGPAGINGVAVIEATATGLVNWRGSSVSTIVDIGDSSPPLPIPANRDVCYIAYLYYDSGATGITNSVCENIASESTLNLTINLGVVAPIDVSVMPEVSDDTAFVQGYVGVPSPKLRIAATTIETTITYQLFSGSLPAGLSLSIFGEALELVGIPTTVGEETFIVRAIDADGNFDDITVTYNVSSIAPPPIIVINTNRFFAGEITTVGGTAQVNLNGLVNNIGGAINRWREVVSLADQAECSTMYSNAGLKGHSADLSLPASVTLDIVTGDLTFNSAEFWLGCLRATNSQGKAIFLFGFEITDTSS